MPIFNREKQADPEIVERQESIFLDYLKRWNLSADDEHAKCVINNIRNGKISTFREERLKRADGSESVITLADANSGNLDKGSFRGLNSKPRDRQLFNSLVTLGFTFNIFDSEPANLESLNGTWRGDGIKE